MGPLRQSRWVWTGRAQPGMKDRTGRRGGDLLFERPRRGVQSTWTVRTACSPRHSPCAPPLHSSHLGSSLCFSLGSSLESPLGSPVHSSLNSTLCPSLGSPLHSSLHSPMPPNPPGSSLSPPPPWAPHWGGGRLRERRVKATPGFWRTHGGRGVALGDGGGEEVTGWPTPWWWLQTKAAHLCSGAMSHIPSISPGHSPQAPHSHPCPKPRPRSAAAALRGPSSRKGSGAGGGRLQEGCTQASTPSQASPPCNLLGHQDLASQR